METGKTTKAKPKNAANGPETAPSGADAPPVQGTAMTVSEETAPVAPRLEIDTPDNAAEEAAEGMLQADSALDLQEAMKGADWLDGAKIVHGGGALPPLFPEDARVGDGRVVRYLGYEWIPKEKSGTGNAFAVLNFAILNPRTGEPRWNAQMPCAAVIEKYFGLEGEGPKDFKPRDPEKTPPLMIVYAGTMKAKKNGFSGAKRFIITEIRGAKETVQGRVVRS